MTTEQRVQIGDIAFLVSAADERRAYWDSVTAGRWEPQTFGALHRFLSGDFSYIDIGAWIGPTALYGANFARRVYAIEPDTTAYAELAANVALNPSPAMRIALNEVCIAPEAGRLQLFAGGMYRGGNSRFGDSMSGIVPTPGDGGQESRTVTGVPLDAFMTAHEITDCGFIKMDVEGAEYSLINGKWRRMSAFGMPALNLSFHAPRAQQREELIGACLEELSLCYRHLYSALDKRVLNAPQLLRGVRDWRDDAPGSAWRQLESLLGAGIVASNTPW
jgi:FkbM family methyltransferase